MPFIADRVRAFLRFTERYTQADMVYVAKGGFWISAGQAAASILSLLLVIAFANLLPKETFGVYRYILSIAGVLNIFTLTGMNSAVARAVAAGDEGAFRSSVRYQLKWNVLMFAAFMALGGYYLAAGNAVFSASFFMLGLFVPATLAFNTYGAYLEGKKEFRFASIANIISTLVYTLGVFAAIALSGEIAWLMFAYAATTGAATLFFYLLVLRTFRPPGGGAGGAIAFGRHMTFIGFIDPIASQIDKIIVAHFWGPAQLAVYSLAMAIPARGAVYIKSLVGLGAPKFATKTPDELNTIFYTRIFQGAAVGTLGALAYIIAVPYLFAYVLPQYLESVLYSQILALSFIFAMPNRYVSLLLVSQKRTREILANTVVLNVLRIILFIALGIWGGILGLVLAFVLYTFLGAVVGVITWRRTFPAAIK